MKNDQPIFLYFISHREEQENPGFRLPKNQLNSLLSAIYVLCSLQVGDTTTQNYVFFFFNICASFSVIKPYRYIFKVQLKFDLILCRSYNWELGRPEMIQSEYEFLILNKECPKIVGSAWTSI
jgi:hypothetical protein